MFPELGQTVSLGDEKIPRESYSPADTRGFSVKLLMMKKSDIYIRKTLELFSKFAWKAMFSYTVDAHLA